MEKRKSIKYIIYALLITMIVGLISLIPNQAKADDVSSSMQILDSIKNSHSAYNGQIPVRFQVLQERHDLYCLGHDDLFWGWQNYKNPLYLRITGNTATDYTSGRAGLSITDVDNGILAYIISTGGGYGYAPGSQADQRNWSSSQIALYKFIDEWIGNPNDSVAQVGERFNVGDWHGVKNSQIDADAAGRDALAQANEILKNAREYANSIGNSTSNSEVVARDTTNKDNIKIDYFTSNGTSYVKVGPFNWTFTGKLNSVTLTGNNGAQPSLIIYKADGTTQTDAAGIESGKNFYVAFRADAGITSISKLEGKGKNADRGIITAELWFMENARYDTQRLMLVNHSTEQPKEYTIITENIPLTLDFSIVKVDEYDQTIALPNVGFKFYNQDAGKYLQFVLNSQNEVTQVNYVNTMEEATELSTDQNGRIELKNVLAGTYIAYETKNPNYGYVINQNGMQIVPSNGEEITLTNKPEYIRLTGLVWEDIQSEKMSVRNDLYHLDDNDDQDILLEGIKVTLKDRRTGEAVTTRIEGLADDQVIQNPTYTDAEGNYSFDYVSSSELENYYVEFEYDGLIYQNVVPHLENIEKGSKAAEPDRQAFNNNYASVEKGDNEYQAISKDAQGNTHGVVNYHKNEAESTDLKRSLEMESTENTEIVATTDETGYAINFEDRVGNEIRNINLGLYKRLQTDLSIRSEIAKVTAEINGYGHVYNYMAGSNAIGNQSIEDWNLGIRSYDGRYKNAYERPVYKADAEYTNADQSKELKMTMTYEISLMNDEQLYTKINEVVSYFNNKYTVNAIGSKINDQSVVGGTVLREGQDYTVEPYNDSFNKLTINTGAFNEIIDPATAAAAEGEAKVTQQKVYVQFNLSRQAIVDMLNEGDQPTKTLDFTSEIASYTSYSDRNGTLYAAYDKDSVPDNATLNDESTYEDDTEKASPIALTIAEARQIRGTIFEDTQIANDQNTAEGNGVFDEATETKLNGVTVELVDESGNPVSYVNEEGNQVTPEITVENGDYTITGFIPGEYEVRFTWGEGTTRIDGAKGYNNGSDKINVENYKSTVMDYNTYNTETSNRKYYMDAGIMNGRSQAIDNTETRAQIDQALQNYNYASDSGIKTISSTTLPMSYGIEYDADELTNVILDGNNVRFLSENVNFGIIRRAEQGLELQKTVSHFRLALQNGQVLVDATVGEDGKLTGETHYLSYLGQGADPSNAVLRAELDQNLMQGSTVQITYTLKATNVGQADFLSDDYGYYRFGESYYNAVGQERKDSDIITASPALIVDYLDDSLQYVQDDQTNIENEWQLVHLDANASEEKNRQELDIEALDNVLTHKYTDADGNEIDLGNYTIYKTAHLANSNLQPKYSRNDAAQSATVQMVAEQNLASGGTDTGTTNKAEIISVTKPGGGETSHTPGNYVPDPDIPGVIPGQEIDDSESPEVVVIPSTGGNMNYVLPITIGVLACVILAGGIFIIKTKVLKKKDE